MNGDVFFVSRMSNRTEKSNSLVLREDPPVAEDETSLCRTPHEGGFLCCNAFLQNLHLCKPASPEARISDILKEVRQCDAPKIFTVIEYVMLYSLQRVWQPHVFDGTLLEDSG